MTEPDLEEFRAVAGRSGFRCRVELVLASLDPDHAARLRAALASPDIQSIAICRIVAKWDLALPLRYNSVRRHRASDCACVH